MISKSNESRHTRFYEISPSAPWLSGREAFLQCLEILPPFDEETIKHSLPHLHRVCSYWLLSSLISEIQVRVRLIKAKTVDIVAWCLASNMHSESRLSSILVFLSLLHRASTAPTPGSAAAQPAVDATVTTLPLSPDSSFDFQLLVALAGAPYRGSDIAEVLKVADVVAPGDYQSFSSAFYALANQTKAAAEDPYNARNPVNVRDTYFAAANYFENADFYLHGNWSDPLIYSLWEEALDCFEKANAALPVPGQRLQLPASGGENFTVEARYFAVDNPQTIQEPCKRPTVILCNGYDASQEDMYHNVGVAALERGFNVITYEGPGQPKVRRDQDIGFIPNWETTLTPVVDYLYSRDDVDTSKIAYLGFSFGGYLAARAAAFEPRVAALMVDGGVYDVHEAFTKQLSPPLSQLYTSDNKTAFDSEVLALLANTSTPTGTRWGIQQGLWSFNIPSPYDFLEYTKPFTLENITERIQMPTWVANAGNDQFYQGQPPVVAAALPHATLKNFTGAAGYHVQAGANEQLNREMFAWLEDTLDVSGTP